MKFNEKILSNGLTLITVPRQENLSVNISVLVGVGSNYESKPISGLAHFMEHMCFKGTTKRPTALSISSELDSLGAEYNAFTTREYTSYYISCLPAKLDQALDIIADMYLNPAFVPEEIEKEKGVIVEEINRAADNPGRHVQDLLVELMYGDTPAGWSVLGFKETVTNVNQNTFLSFRQEHYHAGNTVVAVAGQFNESEMAEKIERYFSHIDNGEAHTTRAAETVQQTPALKLEYKDSGQTSLAFAFHSIGFTDPNFYPAYVLGNILGGSMSSRLFQRVREEMGAAYSINAFQTTYKYYGYLGISAGVRNKMVKEVVRAVLEECRRLTTELVSEAELTRVKDSIIGTTYLSLETPDEIAHYYGSQRVLGRPYETPEEFANKIQAVTPEKIQEIAKQIFQAAGLNLAILGPFKESKEFEDLLTL